MPKDRTNDVKVEIRRPRVPGHVGLFTSLSILVLAFFILLNAFSTADEERRKEAIDSIQFQFLGIFEKTMKVFEVFDNSAQKAQIALDRRNAPGDDLLFILMSDYYDEYKSLAKYVNSYGMGGKLGLVVTSRGVVITVPENLGFAPASSELSDVGRGFLERLTRILRPFRNEILIEGHTDENLPPGSQFESNWDLSQARALSVLLYMRQAGIQKERLSAAGCGQFRPIADNTTPENQALNRRVEIIVKHPDLKNRGIE